MNRRTSQIIHVTIMMSALLSVFAIQMAPPRAHAENWWQSAKAAPLLPPTPAYTSRHRAYLMPLQPASNPSPTIRSVANVAEAQASAVGVSQEWMRHTAHPKLAQALGLMANASAAEPSLQQIQTKNGKVLFKNLAELDPRYANYDALAWLDKQNNWMLFINQKHEAAPPEALAALIAHEAMHSDAHNSRQEEAEAWAVEAKTWMQLKPQGNTAAIANLPLVQRLEKLASAQQDASLYRMVFNHPHYAELPTGSPNFSRIASTDNLEPTQAPQALAAVAQIKSQPTQAGEDSVTPLQPIRRKNNLMAILNQNGEEQGPKLHSLRPAEDRTLATNLQPVPVPMNNVQQSAGYGYGSPNVSAAAPASFTWLAPPVP